MVELKLEHLHRVMAELESYGRLAAAGGLRTRALEGRYGQTGASDPYVAVDRMSDHGDAARARVVWARLGRVAWSERQVLVWLADRGGSRPDAGTVATLYAREHGPIELRDAVDRAEQVRLRSVAAYAKEGPQRGRPLTTAGARSRDRMTQSVREEQVAEAALCAWGAERVGRAIAMWMSIVEEET